MGPRNSSDRSAGILSPHPIRTWDRFRSGRVFVGGVLWVGILLTGCVAFPPVSNRPADSLSPKPPAKDKVQPKTAKPQGPLIPYTYSDESPAVDIRPAGSSSRDVKPSRYDSSTNRSGSYGDAASTETQRDPSRPAARQVDPQREFGSSSQWEGVEPEPPIVTIRRLDEAELQARSQPSRQTSSADSGGVSIVEQQRVLRQIERWLMTQRRLELSEDLALQELLVRAIALFQLEVGAERDYREVVHAGFKKVEEPSKKLRYMMAAFYHELGLEKYRDRVLDGSPMSAPVTNSTEVIREDLSAGAPQLSLFGLSINAVERGGKRLNKVPNRLQAGDSVELLVEASGLVFEGDGPSQMGRVRADISILSSNGPRVHSVTIAPSSISRPAGSPDPYYLKPSFRVPNKPLQGKFQIEVVVSDELAGSGARSVASTEVEIEPRARSRFSSRSSTRNQR